MLGLAAAFAASTTGSPAHESRSRSAKLKRRLETKEQFMVWETMVRWIEVKLQFTMPARRHTLRKAAADHS